MTIKNRIEKLEKHSDEQPLQRPEIIEVWEVREDGTRYLVETWIRTDEGNYEQSKQQDHPT